MPSTARAASAVLLVALLGSCTSPPEPDVDPPPRVLLISVDTLRRDHLGCYGDPDAVTPHLDRLARSGATFTDMMSTCPWTLPAHASLLTGLYPAFHGLQEDGTRLPPAVRTVASAFRERGYATLAVVAHDYVSSLFDLDRGFDVFDDSLIEGFAVNPGAVRIVDRFLRHLDELPRGAFFGFLHFFDPHWDYDPPDPLRRRFLDPDYEGPIDGTYESVRRYTDLPLPPADARQLVGLYDGEIHHLDRQIGRLLRELERRGLRDGTLVAFTADHGEEFKDHGGLGHGMSLYHEQLDIPLIIAGHDAFPGGTLREDPASLVDMAPTLIRMIGGEPPETQGHTLLAEIPDRSRIAESIQFGVEMRAVRVGSYKWVRVPGAVDHGFDVKHDPGERTPLATDPTGGVLRSALEEYEAAADRGWHLKLFAMTDTPVRCRAFVRTEARIVNPRRHFSRILRGKAQFSAFEASSDGRTLAFDVVVRSLWGEVVFDTEPPDAPVTFRIEVASADGQAGLFLGAGEPVPSGRTLTLERSDPRVHGLPRDYGSATSGCYLRAVVPPAETADPVELPEGTVARLRALGYVE